MTTIGELMRRGFDRREAMAIVDALDDAGGSPGGGSGLGFEHQEAWTTAITLRSTGEGGFADGGATWDTPADPENGLEYDWATVGAGADAGRLLLDEGWYNVRLMLTVNFPAAAAITYMRSSFQVGNAAVGNHEDWAAPVVDGSGNKLLHRLINLGVIYSDGFAKIQPSIRWNSGIYSVTSAYMHASLTRLG